MGKKAKPSSRAGLVLDDDGLPSGETRRGAEPSQASSKEGESGLVKSRGEFGPLISRRDDSGRIKSVESPQQLTVGGRPNGECSR